MSKPGVLYSEKELERLHWYIERFVSRQFMLDPQNVVVHECPKCHTRYPLNNVQPFAQQEIVSFIFDWAKANNIARALLWHKIAERIEIAREDGEWL